MGRPRPVALHSPAVSDAPFADTDMPLGADDVETAVFEGAAVLFRESTQMVHRLNSVAGSVWLLCDGATPVGSMAGELGELFGVPPAELTDGIHQALQQLAGEGLLGGSDQPQRLYPEHVEAQAPDGGRILAAPPDP